MSECKYDSGSADGNRPLCDKPATHRVSRFLVGQEVSTEVCDDHIRPTENRIYPAPFTTESI